MTAAPSRSALAPDELRRLDEVDRLAAEPDGAAALVAMLDDPSWTVRRAVVAALATGGRPAFGPLCEALRARRDDEARIAATVDALSALNADVDAALAAMTGGDDVAVLADRRRSWVAAAASPASRRS